MTVVKREYLEDNYPFRTEEEAKAWLEQTNDPWILDYTRMALGDGDSYTQIAVFLHDN